MAPTAQTVHTPVLTITSGFINENEIHFTKSSGYDHNTNSANVLELIPPKSPVTHLHGNVSLARLLGREKSLQPQARACAPASRAQRTDRQSLSHRSPSKPYEGTPQTHQSLQLPILMETRASPSTRKRKVSAAPGQSMCTGFQGPTHG